MKRLKSINIVIIFLFFFIITNCNSKKEKFIPLDKLTFISDYYKDSVRFYYYILIENPNLIEDSLKYKITSYVKNRLDSEKILSQKNVTDIDFIFYKKTNRTGYFIKNKEDPGGFSSELISDYEEDFIANYYIHKKGNYISEVLSFSNKELD